MPRDPVCGNYVDAGTPYKLDEGTDTKYFCSEDCLEEYVYQVDETGEYLQPTGRSPKEED